MPNVLIHRETGEIIEDFSKYDKKLHRFSFVTDGESMTDQSKHDECDLNFMIKKFGAVSLINRALEMGDNNRKPLGDLTQLPEDYQAVLTMSAEVKSEFARLPAQEREKYAHDPLQYLDSLYLAETEALKASDAVSVVETAEAVKTASNGEKTAIDAPNK